MPAVTVLVDNVSTDRVSTLFDGPVEIADDRLTSSAPVQREALLDLGADFLIGSLPGHPKLVALDMDSTLIHAEVIDELAVVHGIGEEVAALTARAMAGGMDYTESLRRRVSLLRGMAWTDVLQVVGRLPLMPGALELASAIRNVDAKACVISGGFDFAAERIRIRVGLDRAWSNRLELCDGALTGGVHQPIVTPERKAELLAAYAKDLRVDLSDTIAIGDGANDRVMLQTAGLGIAFHGKAALCAVADGVVHAGGLDRVGRLVGLL